MIASTANRVRRNTAAEINEQIRAQIEANVVHYAAAGDVAVRQRLAELDEEWDVERYLETMAPTFTLFGLFMGAAVSKKWLLLPAAIQGFFLQHALQGWCPPLGVLRRLGVRTADEINEERFALKALRGDFQGVNGRLESRDQITATLRAVRR